MSTPHIESQPFFPIDDISADTEAELLEHFTHSSLNRLHKNETSILHRLGHASILSVSRPAFCGIDAREKFVAFSSGISAYEVVASATQPSEALTRGDVLKQTALMRYWLRLDTIGNLTALRDYATEHNPQLTTLLGRVARINGISETDYFVTGASTAMQLDLSARVPEI